MNLAPSPLRPRSLAKAFARAVLPESLVVFHGPTRSRRVALTFDDGPSALTREYMNVLERHQARGTFFVVGELCARQPQLVAEIDARGHGLGGHGYTHRRFSELPREELAEHELERTNLLLPERSRRLRHVRPPFGALSLASLYACARAGFTTLLWSRDSGDWRTERPEDVVAGVGAHGLAPGSIVLLHDGQAWTLAALPRILEELREQGHELVTAKELLHG